MVIATGNPAKKI